MKTRAIAFVFEKSEFEEELKQLKHAGRVSAKRDELRIGLVTDKKLVKKYKAKYGATWFPDVSYNTLVHKRYDGQMSYFDFINPEHPQMVPSYWINKFDSC